MFTTKDRFGLGQLYVVATAEAKRRGDRRVGTEHIVLALLADPESVTAQAFGVRPDDARAGLQELDRQALASLGITAELTGPATAVPSRRERLRITPGAKGVFKGLRQAANGERLGLRHVLLVVLDLQSPDPAADLLDQLGVDRAEVRRRLQALS
jgi:ATP-dependent Clp protease ATP-binding subunit ClpA